MIDLCCVGCRWRYRERMLNIFQPGARIYVICNTVVVDTSLAQGLIRLRLFYSHGNIAGPPLSDSITFPQLIQTRGQVGWRDETYNYHFQGGLVMNIVQITRNNAGGMCFNVCCEC